MEGAARVTLNYLSNENTCTTVKLVNLAWFLIWRFLANAHQCQIKDRIKICLHKDGVVLTAPDAKINTGKILF